MINREYKDRLFSFIFGNESRRDWTLSLYNAVNESDYQNPDDIEINTMGDTLYLGMKNDVSFVIGGYVSLYAHQSTYNPNMPLRELIYLGHLLSKYVEQHKLNIYSQRQIRIPIPKLVVFYNGKQDMPEQTVLELKDAFPEGMNPDDSDVSVKVRMLNIHSDKNRRIMSSCRPLYEYASFVDNIYKYRETEDIETAVDMALSDIPDDWIIRNYLMANKSEVRLMCLTEYNEEETMQMFREEGRIEGREEGRIEGREEGREEGRIEGRIKLIVDLVNDEVLTLEEAAIRLGMTVEELKSRIEKES